MSQILPDTVDDAYREFHRLLRGFRDLPLGEIPVVLLTEVLHPSDNRENLSSFDKSKYKEILGMLHRGAFTIVCREEFPTDANILGGQFFLAIKNVETDKPLYKALFLSKVTQITKEICQ